MADGNRNQQYALDSKAVNEALTQYQRPDGHAELTVKIQHGLVTVIEEVRKRKPEKAG